MVGDTEVVGGNDELVEAEVEPLELDVHAAVAPSNPAPINTNNPLSKVDFEIVIACSFGVLLFASRVPVSLIGSIRQGDAASNIL